MRSAIAFTVNKFATQNTAADRNYKMVIISSCEETEASDPCEFASDRSVMFFVDNDKSREVEVVVVNVDTNNADFPARYLECLTKDDSDRYYEVDASESAFQDIVESFKGEVCYDPTQDPM